MSRLYRCHVSESPFPPVDQEFIVLVPISHRSIPHGPGEMSGINSVGSSLLVLSLCSTLRPGGPLPVTSVQVIIQPVCHSSTTALCQGEKSRVIVHRSVRSRPCASLHAVITPFGCFRQPEVPYISIQWHHIRRNMVYLDTGLGMIQIAV